MSPIEFGLPSKFSEWREGQLQAIDQIVERPERFIIVCAPTGFGKSLMYMAAAVMSGRRTVVCTSTKGLQDQLQQDFQEISVDLRGMSNYPCLEAANFGILTPITVEMGPCQAGESCSKRGGGCEYYDRYGAAKVSPLTVTNYALWLTDGQKKKEEEDNSLSQHSPVDMLVLDEAHDAPDSLAGFIGEEISYSIVRKNKLEWLGKGAEAEDWKNWGIDAGLRLEAVIVAARNAIKYGNADAKLLRAAVEAKRMQRRVMKVAGMRGEWVVEWSKRWDGEESVKFDPVTPAEYAEGNLFRGVKKVVLVSATVRPKTAELLGIPKEAAHFQEYHSSFPISRRPVIHVPTVQMSWRTGDLELMWWLGKIDAILEGRRDRKGIIHTVSYERANFIRDNSRHAERMLIHDSKGRADTVARFKAAGAGTVLVSPSVDTGYDFPGEQCEYQIIAKLPFQDNRAKVIKARMKNDKEYSNYMTAQTMVQMTGRGMRSEEDRCETLIIDDNVEWWLRQNKQHFPKWWMESYRSQQEKQAPNPPPKL